MKPRIRLKGFEGEWEENLLGTIATFYSGGTPTAGVSNYYNGSIPFIRSGEIHKDKTQLHISEYGLQASSAKMVEKGTLLYAMYGATSGEVDVSRIRGAINQAVLAIIPQNRLIEKYFLSYLLQCKKETIVGTLIQGGQGNLSADLLKNYFIKYPSLLEQKSIANYFKSLDALIQSTTQKVSSLKQLKEASLISMFPQGGETTPRVRFKGFEGEWEKKQLEACLTISCEKNTDNSFGFEDVLSVSDEFGVMNQIELLGRSYAGKSVSNYGILKKGEIVYTKSPLKSKPYGIIKLNSKKTGIVSVLYAVYIPKDNVCAEYIHYYFSPDWRLNNYLRPLVRKGAKNTMNISDETALKGEIMIPIKFEEQQHIASYFNALDTQITLQEQRLEKLKQLKSACLDQMFV